VSPQLVGQKINNKIYRVQRFLASVGAVLRGFGVLSGLIIVLTLPKQEQEGKVPEKKSKKEMNEEIQKVTRYTMSIQIHHLRRFAVPVAALVVALCITGEFLAQVLRQKPEPSSASTKTSIVNHPISKSDSAPSNANPRKPHSAQPNVNDWFQADRFESEPFLRTSCTYVEHVCHSSGRWWYEPTPGARQLEFTLRTELRGAPGYPETIHVQALDNPRMSRRTCPVSSIPNHIVLYSLYTEMLGEFYVRLLVGLSELARTQTDDFDAFVRQTQLYLHMYDTNDGPMMDSHYLFTDAFRAYPLLDFKSLLHTAGCKCMERLILCGYEEKDDGEGKKMITPSEGLLERGSTWGDEVYKELRETIRRRIILENPLLQDDIKAQREKVLRAKGVKSSFDEWKVMGLALEQKGRRRWLNLEKNLGECDKALRPYKIVCIQVKVEKEKSHSYRQAIVHGALDGLFGIHGGQLTEAVWMKPASLVVEFLPWMHPEVTEGKSARSVKEATPLGVIFSGTDLHHIGYPLQRSSTHYCRGLVDEAETKCWRDATWDRRDFEGRVESIVDAVTMFFVNPVESCAEYQALAADKFVLYNIQCKNDNDIIPSPHHFFWKKELFEISKFVDYTR
jgi:hypothetical protein